MDKQLDIVRKGTCGSVFFGAIVLLMIAWASEPEPIGKGKVEGFWIGSLALVFSLIAYLLWGYILRRKQKT